MVNDETLIVASLMKMLGSDKIDIPENTIRELSRNTEVIVHKQYRILKDISFTIELKEGE